MSIERVWVQVTDKPICEGSTQRADGQWETIIKVERPVFSNGLSAAEAEALALLAEEMGEAQQVIGKILRHGFESGNPDRLVNQGVASITYTNRMELEKELGDVEAAVQIMVNNGFLNTFKITHNIMEKMGKVGKYLHHVKVQP